MGDPAAPGASARAHRPGQAVQAWAGCRGQERQAEQGSANQPRRVPARGRIALARRFRLGLAVGSRSGRLSRGGRSSRAGCQRAGRIALARRFRLGLAVGSRSGRLSRGGRSSRAGCQRRAHRPGQAVQAWAGCREQERQADQGWAIQPRRVPAPGASPWPGGSGLGWLSRAGAAG